MDAAMPSLSRTQKLSPPEQVRGDNHCERRPVSGKLVYRFGGGTADGNAGMRELLGGKGANLAEMCSLGLPVPPGFTITTAVCNAYYESGTSYPDGLAADVDSALAVIEAKVGASFGDAANPLLVSVRSGAPASMPGMMDTVLNLGLNDETVEGLAERSSDRRFAFVSYRRFIQMYGSVVLGIDHHYFEELLENYKLAAAPSSTPTSRPKAGKAWSGSTRRLSRTSSGRLFRRTRRNSSGARSARYSRAG